MQIDYDPNLVSYEELLAIFWDAHAPCIPAYSRQYRAVIFYHDDEQRQSALASKRQAQESMGCEVQAAIEPASAFYLAENYHQKYYLQSNPALMDELWTIYPTFADIVDSTAAARLNGYLGGEESLGGLEAALIHAELEPNVAARLAKLAD